MKKRERRNWTNGNKKGTRGMTTSNTDSNSKAERLEHQQKGTLSPGSHTDPPKKGDRKSIPGQPEKDVASSRQPVSNVASSRQPVTDVASSRQPVTDVESSRQPVSDVASSRRPDKDVASSRQTTKDVTSRQPKKDVTSSSQPVSEVASSRQPDTDVASSRQTTKDVTSRQPKKDVTSSSQPVSDVASSRQPDTDVASSRQTTKDVTSRQPKKDVTSSSQPVSDVASSRQPDTDVASSCQTTKDVTSRQPKKDVTSSSQPVSDVESSRQPDTDVASSRQPESDVASYRQPESDVESSRMNRQDILKACSQYLQKMDSPGQCIKSAPNTSGFSLHVDAPEFIPSSKFLRTSGNFPSDPHPSSFVDGLNKPQRTPGNFPPEFIPPSDLSRTSGHFPPAFIPSHRLRTSDNFPPDPHPSTLVSRWSKPPHKPDRHQPAACENSPQGYLLRHGLLHGVGTMPRDGRSIAGAGEYSHVAASAQQPNANGHWGMRFALNAPLNPLDRNAKHHDGTRHPNQQPGHHHTHFEQNLHRLHHSSSVRPHGRFEQRNGFLHAIDSSKAGFTQPDVSSPSVRDFQQIKVHPQKGCYGMTSDNSKHDSTHHLNPSQPSLVPSGRQDGQCVTPSQPLSMPMGKQDGQYSIHSQPSSMPSGRQDGQHSIPSQPSSTPSGRQDDQYSTPLQASTSSGRHDGQYSIPSQPSTPTGRYEGMPIILSDPRRSQLFPLNDGTDPVPSNQPSTRSDKHGGGLPLNHPPPHPPLVETQEQAAPLCSEQGAAPLENPVDDVSQNQLFAKWLASWKMTDAFRSDYGFLCWGITEMEVATTCVDTEKFSIVTSTPEDLWDLYVYNSNTMGLLACSQFLVDLGLRFHSKAALVLAWKFGMSTKGMISKVQFVDGFRKLGCEANLSALRNRCLLLGEEFDRPIQRSLSNKPSDPSEVYADAHNHTQETVFREFYEFVFRHCVKPRGGCADSLPRNASLEIGDAVYLWATIMPRRFRSIVKRWIEFWKNESPSDSRVSMEEWTRFLRFCHYCLTFRLEDAVQVLGNHKFAEYLQRRPLSPLGVFV